MYLRYINLQDLKLPEMCYVGPFTEEATIDQFQAVIKQVRNEDPCLGMKDVTLEVVRWIKNANFAAILPQNFRFTVIDKKGKMVKDIPIGPLCLAMHEIE